MRRQRRFGSGRILILSILLLVAAPLQALAADGEIGDMGDTDSITEPYRGGDGRPTINIDYLRDCPAGGVTDCWIEVRWASRCPEIWCGWDFYNFQRIPSSGVAKGPCLGGGNEDNEWLVDYRTAYVASGTRKITWKGENELVLGGGGTFVYRMMAEAMFNVTYNVGYRTGYNIETVTAISDYSPIVTASSTGGLDLHTC